MLKVSAGQIPILPGSEPPSKFGLSEVRFMEVDYAEVARKIEEIQPYLKRWAIRSRRRLDELDPDLRFPTWPHLQRGVAFRRPPV